MRFKKFAIIISTLFAICLLGAYLHQDSYYSKQTRAEVIWRTFMYSTENQIASVWSVFKKEKAFTLDVPLFKQTHPVTCEAASLRMVLDYYGHTLSEDELLTKLHFDTTLPITPEGVWGDPDKGFVGNVDGSIFERTGYGVHDGPIRKLASLYQGVVELQKPDLVKLIGLVNSGKPVIVWGLLSKRDTVTWRTYGGKKVEVYPGEHVRVVIGYTGTAEDPDNLILLDPIYGKIRMSVDKFVRDWETMNNRAVVVL